MIFIASAILLALVGIYRILDRIREDIRSICRWYCEDQK